MGVPLPGRTFGVVIGESRLSDEREDEEAEDEEAEDEALDSSTQPLASRNGHEITLSTLSSLAAKDYSMYILFLSRHFPFDFARLDRRAFPARV